MIDERTVKNIIKKNKNLIEEERWEEFFNKAASGSNNRVPIINFIFEDCNLNFLEYMSRIPSGLFKDTSVSVVDIPDSIKQIGTSAFDGCSNLRTVVINAPISEIPVNCFAYCHQLESVTLPDTVVKIGNGAFKGCDNVEIRTNKRTDSNKLRCGSNDVEFLKKHLKFN